VVSYYFSGAIYRVEGKNVLRKNGQKRAKGGMDLVLDAICDPARRRENGFSASPKFFEVN
jgi:hypothetical protein